MTEATDNKASTDPVSDGERSDAEHIDDDDDVHIEDEEVHRETEWDEGGSSHCGYSESVHDTLMTMGKAVHNVVGDPKPSTEDGTMRHVGNWFQEASYAVRDIVRGNHGEVASDLNDTVSSMKQELMETGSVVSGAFGGVSSPTSAAVDAGVDGENKVSTPVPAA